MIRDIGILLSCFVFLVFILFWPPKEPDHTHVPLEYKVLGRYYTDTLCISDTTMFNKGRHYPVPEILERVVRKKLEQPIKDKPHYD